ncbi:hypothetical protein SLEP1_g54151 [Rubroshorea leprosula]|uniref:Uncharacterized protein n=1 Tax=Rubroshorea leprosula TaxID=152421 RepID=A0AAV5MCK4_9ROSI|nr:hypothetical protein SLEP1_g54151 [Rubroshorea leprosula]
MGFDCQDGLSLVLEFREIGSGGENNGAVVSRELFPGGGVGGDFMVSEGQSAKNKWIDLSFEKIETDEVRAIQQPSQQQQQVKKSRQGPRKTGTVVKRSPRGSESLTPKLCDASISETVVLRGQHSNSPRTPKSGLGILERNSNASLEDSVTNLAEAKAAMQAGLRKRKAGERSALGKSLKYNNSIPEVPVNILMHKEHFQDRAKLAVIMKEQR